VIFIIILLGSGTGYTFFSFPTESCFEFYLFLGFEECGFHYFFFPLLQLVLFNSGLDQLVDDLNCLFSFPGFNFCVMTDLIVR
jgi:hypothetical protein